MRPYLEIKRNLWRRGLPGRTTVEIVAGSDAGTGVSTVDREGGTSGGGWTGPASDGDAEPEGGSLSALAPGEPAPLLLPPFFRPGVFSSAIVCSEHTYEVRVSASISRKEID